MSWCWVSGAPSLMNMEETTKRGRFMMTEENMYDEDYFDYQLPEKKRRLTPEQVQLLEKSFEEENKLEPDRKSDLAKKLGLPPRQVAVWFQNRRARWKTKQLEKEFDQLKSAYDSLLTNYEFVLRENLNLKSQVVSLREKLEAQEVEAAVVRKHFGESLPGEAAVFTHATAGDEDGLSSGRAAVYDDGHQLAFQVNSEEDDGSDGYRSDLSNVIGPPEELESLMWCTWS